MKEIASCVRSLSNEEIHLIGGGTPPYIYPSWYTQTHNFFIYLFDPTIGNPYAPIENSLPPDLFQPTSMAD